MSQTTELLAREVGASQKYGEASLARAWVVRAGDMYARLER